MAVLRQQSAMENRHGPLTVVQLPCLQDNYAFLLKDEGSGTVATVDTPDADAIGAALNERGWGLDLILNTHWHPDHTGGNEALKARFGAHIVGPAGEDDRIPGRDRAVVDGDQVAFGGLNAQVLETPGHTKGHIVFHFADQKVGFVGDTLFSLGCGRLFEGTPAQMWTSLGKLRAMPPETVLYCAHEYTAANAKFALSLEPDHAPLKERAAEIERLRAEGQPTVPMTLSQELQTNPFLRADDPALAASVGLRGAAPTDVFADVRRRKDEF